MILILCNFFIDNSHYQITSIITNDADEETFEIPQEQIHPFVRVDPTNPLREYKNIIYQF